MQYSFFHSTVLMMLLALVKLMKRPLMRLWKIMQLNVVSRRSVRKDTATFTENKKLGHKMRSRSESNSGWGMCKKQKKKAGSIVSYNVVTGGCSWWQRGKKFGNQRLNTNAFRSAKLQGMIMNWVISQLSPGELQLTYNLVQRCWLEKVKRLQLWGASIFLEIIWAA